MNEQRYISGQVFVGILVFALVISMFLGEGANSAPAALNPQFQEMTFVAYKDAHTDEANSSSNYGSSANLIIGRDATYDKFGFFDFNMTNLPVDAVVISATLQIFIEVNRPAEDINAPDVDTLTLLVHAVTGSWDEATITWDNQPGSVQKGDPSLSISPTASGWQYLDVTKIIESWVDASQMKYGIKVWPSRGTNITRSFVSSEGSVTYKPKLVVRFTSEIPTDTPTPTNTSTATATSTSTPESNCPGTVILAPDSDTTTDSSAPMSVYGSQETILVGAGPGYAFQSFLHFPVEDNFLPGDYIYNARVELIVSDKYTTNPFHSVMAFTLNGTFDEATTNWNNQPYMRKVLPLPEIDSTLATVNWDMTMPVRDWVEGTEENTGLGIMAIDPGNEFWFKFHSRETDIYQAKPYLVIECGDVAPTPTPTATNTPTPTSTPVPTDPPPITLDIDVFDMEITQGLQDLQGSIPLLAGKRTFVRLYAQTFDTRPDPPDIYSIAGKLMVYKEGVYQETLQPINRPTGLVMLKHLPERTKLDDAFLFELPSEYTTEGDIRLLGVVNSEFDLPYHPETDNTNNSITMDITFEPPKALALGLYEVHYTHWEDGLVRYPNFSEMMTVLGRLKNEYPITDTPYFIRHLLATDTQYVSENDFEWANEYIESDAFYDAVGGDPFINGYDTVRYHALWKDYSGRHPDETLNGLSNGIPGPSASSFVDGHSIMAHELGHNFGRHHTPECGADTGCVGPFPWGYSCAVGFEEFPYNDGQLGPSEYEWLGTTPIGFSHYNPDGEIRLKYYPDTKDIMTYCSRWTSDFTFKRLRSYMGPDSVSKLSINALMKTKEGSAEGDYLVISGVIDEDPFQVNLSPVFVLPDINYTYTPPSRPLLDIVLKDSRGGELVRYGFNPRVSLDSQTCSVSGDDDPDESLTFFEVVPYHPDTATIVIEWDGDVLTGVQAGITPPMVRITSPNGGEILDTDTIQVDWTAKDDEEGTNLHYRLSYSKDGGTTWDLVASGLTETHAFIPTANLPATNQGLFRVWASDGIHTSYDDSDKTFTIPNAGPYLEITSPISGTVYILGQTVTMMANAYDPDDGSMDGDQITWFSTVDGEIGVGDLLSLTDLSVGQHIILAVASDGSGGMAGDSVKIAIYADAGALPPLPGDLRVAPGSVYFNPANGDTSQVLDVYDGNLGDSIPWEVVASDPWINVSAARTGGGTPESVAVGVDTSGLEFGFHEGSLTFANLADPDDVFVVSVLLYFDPWQIYLPMNIR
jgi:hypothetical protein